MLKKWLNARLDALTQMTPGQHVQYLGHQGVTQCCVEAVERLLHRHREIESVRLLSCQHRHAFLFSLAYAEFVIVRAGFTSDSGEGSRGLRRALNLIQSVGLEIEESDVEDGLFARLNHAALAGDDLDKLAALQVVRPMRLWDYGIAEHVRGWQRVGCMVCPECYC